jgi:hypothetical protein
MDHWRPGPSTSSAINITPRAAIIHLPTVQWTTLPVPLGKPLRSSGVVLANEDVSQIAQPLDAQLQGEVSLATWFHLGE